MKGERSPSQTRLKEAANGIYLSVVARADDRDEANDVSVYFIGRMLDMLSLHIDTPLYLSIFKPQFRVSEDHVRRIVPENEWLTAFEKGQRYGVVRSTFCRSLSWYRKGLTAEDPIDKLLAFWATLESIASKYAERNARAETGVINKICNCFDQLWANCDNWKVIPSEAHWINRFCQKRNDIAHGALRIAYAENIREVAELVPKLKELAFNFLRDWDLHGQPLEIERD